MSGQGQRLHKACFLKPNNAEHSPAPSCKPSSKGSQRALAVWLMAWEKTGQLTALSNGLEVVGEYND